MKKKDGFQGYSTRREFLVGTTGIALTTVLPSCSHTSDTTVPEGMTEPTIATVTDQELAGRCAWIGRNEHKTAYALFKNTVEATTDFAWLSTGDRVLVKIALNSGKSYPATTDPWAVHCMIKLLKEKGAGEILVGDQGGYGTVRWTKNTKEGSSRQLAKDAGLFKAIKESDAKPCFFEEYGWDHYRTAIPNGNHHWHTP